MGEFDFNLEGGGALREKIFANLTPNSVFVSPPPPRSYQRRRGGGGSSDRRSHRKRLLSSEYDTHGRAGGRTEGKREGKVFFLRLYTKSVTQARYAQLLKKPSDENENSVSPSRRKKKIASINTLLGREGDNGRRKEGFFISSFPSPSARANTIVLLSTSLPFFPLRHPSIPTLPPSSSSTSFQKKSGSNRCHRREVRRVGSEGHLWRLFTTVGTPPPSSIGDWSQDLHGNWSCHWKKGKEEEGNLQSPITPRTERPAEPTGLFFYLPSSFFSFVMGRVGFKLLLQSLPSSSFGKTLSPSASIIIILIAHGDSAAPGRSVGRSRSGIHPISNPSHAIHAREGVGGGKNPFPSFSHDASTREER